jgi:anti-sigma B factor antagonist
MLAVREHIYHHTKILDLSGRFDANSKLGLEVAILGAKEMGCQHIVLNFSDITWIDSMGLGQLFLWYHNMRVNHVHLSIVSPQPTVKDLLESAHLPDIVPIYQSEKEAVEAHATSHPPLTDD